MIEHAPWDNRPGERTRTRLFTAAILALLALRLPSLWQPAGGDQGLYAYEGQRILAGDVLYRDAWDQKPPGIAFIYAALQSISHGSWIVPAADLACATIVAVMLISVGRRRFITEIGYCAALLFLLLGDPYLQRLGGVYVRGQCEPFINVAVCAAVLLLAQPRKSRRHFIGSGIALGAAFWLKYNTAAYALLIAAALWAWSTDQTKNRQNLVGPTIWIGLGVALLTLPIVVYFWTHMALTDLVLATVQYNLGYSSETYRSPASTVQYLVTFPFERARVDFLWFMGGLGGILLIWRAGLDRSTAVLLAWLLAAAVSVAINGSRDLPNYFVQAGPPLALSAIAGLATLSRSGLSTRVVVAVLLGLGIWRVGSEAPVLGLRLAGLPGLFENAAYDLAFARGRTDRDEYLKRFKGKKFNAYEIDRLAEFIRRSTDRRDRVLVFGFSGGGVCWKSERASASRFFWSMPVMREFAAERPGYGSAGLLAELRQHPPTVVALQKEEDWRSKEFFLREPHLREWLVANYRIDHDTPMFDVWRRVR